MVDPKHNQAVDCNGRKVQVDDPVRSTPALAGQGRILKGVVVRVGGRDKGNTRRNCIGVRLEDGHELSSAAFLWEVGDPKRTKVPAPSTATHELKTDPVPFEATLQGSKRYELRKYDRSFKVGDCLRLREHDRSTGQYTGRVVLMRVTYLSLPGSYGLPHDLCCMSLEPHNP